MTDSDVIKALEYCTGKEGGCNGCIFNDVDDIYCWSCEWELKNAAMEVIKRQQAEIERLEGYAANMEYCANHALDEIEKEKREAIKDFAERLKARVKETANEKPDGGHVCESEIVGIINELVSEMEGADA